MDQGDATGIAGIIIGLAASVSSVAAVFLFPDVAPGIRHLLFWGGLLVVLCSGLFLFDIHWLGRQRKKWRVLFPIALVSGYVALVASLEPPHNESMPDGLVSPDNSGPKSSTDIRRQFIGPLEGFYFKGTHIKSEIIASEVQYSEIQINHMRVWRVDVLDWVCNNMGEYALAELSNIPVDLAPSKAGSDAKAKAVTTITILLENLNALIASDTWDPHGNPQVPPAGCKTYLGKATDAQFTAAP